MFFVFFLFGLSFSTYWWGDVPAQSPKDHTHPNHNLFTLLLLDAGDTEVSSCHTTRRQSSFFSGCETLEIMVHFFVTIYSLVYTFSLVYIVFVFVCIAKGTITKMLFSNLVLYNNNSIKLESWIGSTLRVYCILASTLVFMFDVFLSLSDWNFLP